MGKLVDLIDRSLNTRITPLAYLFALLSIVRGMGYTFFQTSEGVSSTVLFKIGPVIPPTAFGVLILSTAIILLGGMVIKSSVLVMAGSLGLFLSWVFTATAYFSNGYYFFLLPTAILQALAFGYFYLAASLGRLWDYTPYRA
jgi:hypothetical protein